MTETVELTAIPNFRGQLTFDETKSGRITFALKMDNKALYKKIAIYLGKTKRDYKIPESSKLDDYRVDKAIPIQNLTYFELALCELKSRFGVEVTWPTGGLDVEVKKKLVG